ncbi:MAG: VOC family protein [Ferruginibacter sp.]
MEAIIPYLNFNGNAAEALAFYAKVLDGKILHQQTFGESPVPSTPQMKDKIMHALFQADKLTLMVSDCPPDFSVTTGSNVSLSLGFNDEASIDKTFAALSEGSKITMPLQDTFWGAKFGMLTDPFGINWMFNYDKPKA